MYGFGLGRRRTMGEKGTHALLLNDRTRWDVGFRKTCGVRNIFTVFSLLKESLRKGNNWVGKSFAVKQWLKYVVYTWFHFHCTCPTSKATRSPLNAGIWACLNSREHCSRGCKQQHILTLLPAPSVINGPAYRNILGLLQLRKKGVQPLQLPLTWITQRNTM